MSGVDALERVGASAATPLSRRAVLRLAMAAALGLPAALAACGKTTTFDARADDFVLEIVKYRPPVGDLARLMADRAKALNMMPTLSSVTPEGLAEDLRNHSRTSKQHFDPQTNGYPPQSALLVVPAIEAATIAPLLATAAGRGVKIVAYPAPLPHQDAAILVDARRAAEMLARHAAGWADVHLGGRGDVLLLAPPAQAVAQDPFAAIAADIGPTLGARLAADAPGLRVVATEPCAGFAVYGADVVARALAAHRSIRMVLSWDDAAALGAVQALRRRAGGGDGVYVGALALPGVTSRATVAGLRAGGPLRAVVAARVRDFAFAAVELSHALLGGAPARDVRLPLRLLAADAPALSDVAEDYARHPAPQLPANQPLYVPDGSYRYRTQTAPASSTADGT